MNCRFTSAHVITKSQQTWILLIVWYRLSLNQHGVLNIRGALPEDAGNYTCLATNEAGSASQSVSLTFAGESRYRYMSGWGCCYPSNKATPFLSVLLTLFRELSFLNQSVNDIQCSVSRAQLWVERAWPHAALSHTIGYFSACFVIADSCRPEVSVMACQ